MQDVSWKVSPRIEEEFQEDILLWAEDNRDDDVSDEIREVCKRLLSMHTPCLTARDPHPCSLHSTCHTFMEVQRHGE